MSSAAVSSPPAQRWVDGALALVVVAYGVAEAALSSDRSDPRAVVSVVLLSALPVAVQSRWPVPAALVAAVSLVVTAVVAPGGDSFVPFLGPALTAYTVGRSADNRGFLLVLAAHVVAHATAAVLPEPRPAPSDIGFTAAAVLLALAVGRASSEMQLETDVLRLEAAGSEARRAIDVQAATEAERLRIARELHDVLGHTISVMSIQAAAVRRRLRPEQEQERAALEAVESAGRESVAEVRRLLGLLRDDGAGGHVELASGARLSTIVDDVRRAGLDVQISGTELVDEIAPGLAVTVVRIVQEGVTNALRHAPRSRVTVTLARSREGLLVSIVDDGAGVVPSAASRGFGLVGMRERVAVFGGDLVARPRDAGGFELLARLPDAGS